MRILMLSQFYAPTVGGEESLIRDLSRSLAARGHHVTVATAQQRGMPADEMDGDVRVRRLATSFGRTDALFTDLHRRHSPPAPDPEGVIGLRSIIMEQQPHVVHAHNWLVHSFVPLKRWSGRPLVLSLHDYSLICSTKRLRRMGVTDCPGPGVRACLKCSARHYGSVKGPVVAATHLATGINLRRAVDRFLPVSPVVARRSGLYGSGLPFEVIPNFLSDEAFLPHPVDDRRLNDLPRGPYIVYAGDLSRQKGVDVLLDAYDGLVAPPPLVLLGRPGDVDPAGRPGVRTLGALPRDLVAEAFRRCAVAVAPSVWDEPFGLVALEAMAAARPVVASSAGFLGDLVVDGVTGLIAAPSNVGALRDALARLLADEALRARLGSAARDRAATYSASAIVPRFEAVYEAVRQDGPRSA